MLPQERTSPTPPHLIGVCAHYAGAGVRRAVGEYVRSMLGLFYMRVLEAIDRQEGQQRVVREKLSRPFEEDSLLRRY